MGKPSWFWIHNPHLHPKSFSFFLFLTQRKVLLFVWSFVHYQNPRLTRKPSVEYTCLLSLIQRRSINKHGSCEPILNEKGSAVVYTWARSRQHFTITKWSLWVYKYCPAPAMEYMESCLCCVYVCDSSWIVNSKCFLGSSTIRRYHRWRASQPAQMKPRKKLIIIIVIIIIEQHFGWVTETEHSQTAAPQ